jgi:hypothetical protein
MRRSLAGASCLRGEGRGRRTVRSVAEVHLPARVSVLLPPYRCTSERCSRRSTFD